MNNSWQLQDAKSKFSEVVEKALHEGTQIVTRRGKKAVVVMPYDEYEKITCKRDNLAEYLLAYPFGGSELSLERDKSTGRDLEIER
jgi:antitoxin Phd